MKSKKCYNKVLRFYNVMLQFCFILISNYQLIIKYSVTSVTGYTRN